MVARKKASKVRASKKSKIKSKNTSKAKKTGKRAARGKSPSRGKSTKESFSMEELLQEFGSNIHALSVGDWVKGKIVRKEPGRVLINIGGKTEGLVAEKAYKLAEDYIKRLKPGDEVDAKVLVTVTPDGYTILSLKQAAEEETWKKLKKSFDKEEPITVEGKSTTSAGITVSVDGLTGFIPLSQLGSGVSKNPQSLMNKKFEAVVIDYDRDEHRLVMSEREVSEKEEIDKAKKAMQKIKEGDVFEGVVTSIFDFGCFVRIKAAPAKGKEKVELEGLVHISEMAWGKVDKPQDMVAEGDKVKVKVIGKQKGKLALSMKQAKKDPWDEVEKKYKKDTKTKGKVVKTSDFGVFVELEPGVEGLLHITKIPPGRKFTRGESVNVYVEEIDSKARKIALGLVLTVKPVGYK